MEKKTRRRPSWALLALTLSGLALSVAAVVAALPSKQASAIAPCVQHTPSGDELTFLAAVQSWRDANIPGSHQLIMSAPLNAAAEGYAQFVANTPGASGHSADGAGGQFPWVTRALACGYPSNLGAGSEGVANASTANQALTVLLGHTGSGVFVPSNVGAPVKCAGVGKATNAGGTKTTWVVLLFAGGAQCSQAVTGGPQPSATNTFTPTSTPTQTATPTPIRRYLPQTARD